MKILAVVTVASRDAAKGWYAKLFGRPADKEPMSEVAEWYFGDGGFQLVENAERAGKAFLTLAVDNLDAERSRLAEAGLELGAASGGDYARIAQVTDPDGNVITLAEPGPGMDR